MNESTPSPTIFGMLPIKRESAPTPTPAAGTSSASEAAALSMEMMEGETEDLNDLVMTSSDLDVGQEGDGYEDDDEGGNFSGDDYPPNYGAPKSEVEKLRVELVRVKEMFDSQRKSLEVFEKEKKSMEEEFEKERKSLEEALSESEEDRMHARIILQYEKDEKERFQKMFYDEQRKTKQVRGQLNAILGVRSRLNGEGDNEKDEDAVTCLGTVVKVKKSGGGMGNRPGIISPIIDRTQVYATNRNNVGGAVQKQRALPPPSPPPMPALLAPSTPPQKQQQRPSQVLKPVVRPNGPKLEVNSNPIPIGVGPMLSQQVAPPSSPPPAPPTPQRRPPRQLSKAERFNIARKVYRGIGTLSRPRAPQPSTSQTAVVKVENTHPGQVKEGGSRTLPISRARRTYRKRGSRGKPVTATQQRDAAYFKRNKNKSNFPCNLCSQRFLKLSLLKYHKSKSHNVLDLSLEGVGCVECGFVFPDRKTLFDHRLTIHNIAHPFRNSSGGTSANEDKREG